MKKYIEIVKIYLKAQLIWRADVVFNMILTVTKIIFAYLLWGIIFAENEMVAGFTFHSMLSYYIISSFISQLEMSGEISREITMKIRNGTFSKFMVIPINIERYFFAMEMGKVLFYISFDLAAAIFWVIIFKIQFVITDNIISIIGALVMIVLGLVFMVQLNYFLGILTFKFQEISTFLMIKDNLVVFITGSVIPLTLLPEKIITLMKFFPFYYITYLPSMILIGRCEKEAILGVFPILGWCVFMKFVNQLIYEKYRVEFDGVGV